MGSTDSSRRKRSKGWLLIPIAIVVIAVVGLVISSFQRELGLAAPGESGRAAAAAALDVDRVLASDQGPASFSSALLVAVKAHENMAKTNTADTRLDHLLTGALDCYLALREAQQASADSIWDDTIQGDPGFWETVHPFLDFSEPGPLTSDEVISQCRSQASRLLKQVVELAG